MIQSDAGRARSLDDSLASVMFAGNMRRDENVLGYGVRTLYNHLNRHAEPAGGA